MMTRDQHVANLKNSVNWIAYLEDHSGLPGKRGNLEVMETIMEIEEVKPSGYLEKVLDMDLA